MGMSISHIAARTASWWTAVNFMLNSTAQLTEVSSVIGQTGQLADIVASALAVLYAEH